MTTSSGFVHQKSVHTFKVIFPSNERLALKQFRNQTNIIQPIEAKAQKKIHIFKVHYPAGGTKPFFGSSLFPGSLEMFLPGSHQWTEAASTLPRRNAGTTESMFSNL